MKSGLKTSKVERYLKYAEATSELSSYPRIKIGAVIVRKNSVLAVGVNEEKSHPIQKRYNIYRDIDVEIEHNIHAEMAALIKCRESLKGADIYIYRKDSNGNTAICKPCAACRKALLDSGIRRVYYTTSDGYAVDYYNV